MLFGQCYYSTDTFPSQNFKLSYDFEDALMDIASDEPYLEPRTLFNASSNEAKELHLVALDHAVVDAENLDSAIEEFKKLKAVRTC